MAENSSTKSSGLNGACLCGSVTFELLENPFKVLQCYCLDCQKGAGGPCQIVRILSPSLPSSSPAPTMSSPGRNTSLNKVNAGFGVQRH